MSRRYSKLLEAEMAKKSVKMKNNKKIEEHSGLAHRAQCLGTTDYDCLIYFYLLRIGINSSKSNQFKR